MKQSAVSERKDMMEAPELRTHVFCRVTEDVGAVAVDDSGRVPAPCFCARLMCSWLLSVESNPELLCIMLGKAYESGADADSTDVLCRVEMQDFVVNDLYAVRYDRIRDLLARDEVELV